MSYATIEDIKARYDIPLNENTCMALLEDSAVVIDAYNRKATADVKKVVSCRMVLRALGTGSGADVPIGATQGTMSALGFSQSWALSSGATGELYLSKLDKKLLGTGNKIGSHSPLEDLR